MDRFLYFYIFILIFSGCASIESNRDRFISTRNYEVGSSIGLSHAAPLKISLYNQHQDKYLFEWKDGCSWVYYVNKETKIIESWQYISSPDKCFIKVDWGGIW